MSPPTAIHIIEQQEDRLANSPCVTTSRFDDGGRTVSGYVTEESPNLVDCAEGIPSGFVIVGPKETDPGRQLTFLWRTEPLSWGLIGLSTFLAIEADRPEPAHTRTVSWESETETRKYESKASQSKLFFEQARQVAFQVFAKAEREIQAEREADAQSLAYLWQEEEL